MNKMNPETVRSRKFDFNHGMLWKRAMREEQREGKCVCIILAFRIGEIQAIYTRDCFSREEEKSGKSG